LEGVGVYFGEGDAASGDHGAVEAFGVGDGDGEGGEGRGKGLKVATGGAGRGEVGREVCGGEEVFGPCAGDFAGKEVAEVGGAARGAPGGEEGKPFGRPALRAGRNE